MLTEMTNSSTSGGAMTSDVVHNGSGERDLQCNGAVTVVKPGAKTDQNSAEQVSHRSNGDVVSRTAPTRTRYDSVVNEDTAVLDGKDALRKRDAPVIEDDLKCTPIELLPGESLIRMSLGAFNHQIIMLTTYRLFITYSKSFVNLPLRLVESVDIHDTSGVTVLCKDGTVHNFLLPNSESCFKWLHAIKQELGPVTQFLDYFAVSFAVVSKSDNTAPWVLQSESRYKLGDELERLRFNLKTTWRIANINDNYKYCKSYPKENVVPKDFDDSMLEKAATFRTLCRFPTAVWRHDNGAVLLRASQPVVGVFCQRNTDDENLLQAIIKACGCGERMLIVDARSYTAAVANRAKGGGCEYSEYYTNCDIEFMNLPNIHAIRGSFSQLRTLISNNTDSANWYAGLDSCKWMLNMSTLLYASKHVADTLARQPVLVHCSDGWDRTPQIVSLAQIILDPHYRTFKGFQVLIEKDWLVFGHKFLDRCGHSGSSADAHEVSPVFLQWLDAVHQLTKQFPTAFEFDEVYLIKLLQHTYSCMFGTFLFNNEKDRLDTGMSGDTACVWSLLDTLRTQLTNKLYSPGAHKVLNVNAHASSLVLWTSVYAAQASHTDHDIVPPTDESTGLQRSQSYSDLSTSTESNLHLLSRSPRRLSDPDLPNNSLTNLADSSSINGSGTLAQSPANGALSNSLTGSHANIVVNGIQNGELRSRNSSDASTRDVVITPKQSKLKSLHSSNSKDEMQYTKYLDIDGLTTISSPARQKLDDVVSRYESEIRELKEKIAQLQTRPPHSPGSCCRGLLVPECQILGDGGPSSAGSNSSHQSDSSWETLSNKEAGLTLWIPDHAVSYCSSCNVPFRVYRRRHHCRQCGQVFCQSCADVFVPIPEQQLYEPVRVCTSCHKQRKGKDIELDEADILAANLQTPTHEAGSSKTNGHATENPAKQRVNGTDCEVDAPVPHALSKPIPVKNSPVRSARDDVVICQQQASSSPRLTHELSSSQMSLHSNSSLVYDGRSCQKTCSQESINMENSADGQRMMGARAEC